LLSLGQWDIKRIMAYSTISQIGYIFIGFGLATPFGFMAALFHLFNHAFMKALLFLNAGAIECLTGTRDLRRMGGLAKKLPVTYATNIIGSLAISGLPPFNGFWSKLFIIIACLQAGQLGAALVAVVGSILTLAAYLKIQKEAFTSPAIAELTEPKRLSFTMGTAMIILALSCLLIGLSFPIIINYVINPAVASLVKGVGYGSLILGVIK
jgi:multicomponent Na+:H+ antiporter subunit D